MAYIKKEPIIDFITKGLNNPDKTKAYGYDAIEILTEIEYTPTADVVEVKHGKWEKPTLNLECFADGYVICSECNVMLPNITEIPEYYYCPYCGAKMDRGGKK